MNAGSSSSPYFTLTLPNEFLTYNVRVAAVNNQGKVGSNGLTLCPGRNRKRGVCIQCKLQYIYSTCTHGGHHLRMLQLTLVVFFLEALVHLVMCTQTNLYNYRHTLQLALCGDGGCVFCCFLYVVVVACCGSGCTWR